MKKIAVLIISILSFVGCGHDDGDDRIIVLDDQIPSVTVLFSMNGPGDNGYNDLIVNGLMHFCDSADIALHTFQPSSMDEARQMTLKWLSETEGRTPQSMLVLASSTYADIASGLDSITDGKRCVVLIESEKTDMPKGVMTACVNRRGVMYLAGALSARTPAYIVAAMPGDEIVDVAIDAFKAGYESHEMGYRIEDIHYLSDNADGYSMPNDAYKYMADLMHAKQEQSFMSGDVYEQRYILLPMAGGSNTGIYYYLMQSFNSLQSFQAVVGMDVDYSNRLDMLPFSVVLNVDKMLCDIIENWKGGMALAGHLTYSMADGYANVILNKAFNNIGIYSLEEYVEDIGDGNYYVYQDYLPDDYWTNKYDELLSEASAYEDSCLK